jgi:Xaa-Pro aminopeptidase
VLPPADLLATRHSIIRKALEALGLERLLVTRLPNLRWLTGFDGSTGEALVEPGRVVLVVDGRYAESAEGLAAHTGDLVRIERVEKTHDETVAALIAGSTAPIGFEATDLSVARHLWFQAWLRGRGWDPIGLQPTADVVESGRIVKDPWELALLREAGARLSAVTLGVLADLQAGVPETMVAQAVEAGLRRAGFDGPAFDTIVASGPRAALPHGRASARSIGRGELVVLDLGGIYGGYCVDLTRTIALGDPGSDARAWYTAVLEAQSAAIAAVAPGRTPHDIDRAARQVLDTHGLGPRFTHGTGHGLGLEVHEAPRIGPLRTDAAGAPIAGTARLPEHLVPGMVFTIEPGAYVPGRGGVRIEDDVLVTVSGVEVLTNVPRTLVLD